ncbi:MAG: hypothetical protein ACH350_06750 [Parachlamydiaceae bacterium]
MVHFFSTSISLFILMSLFYVNSTEAYCSRCVKIEAERAKEQEANPQVIGYYDDKAKTNHQTDPQQIEHPKEINK